MKRAVIEPESAALDAFLDAHPEQASCALARVEVIRAVRPHGDEDLERAHEIVRQLRLVQIDDDLLDEAASIDPWTLRSLDAIHVAAAKSLADDLEAVVTYDRRMREAAEANGLRVEAPA